jgi:hypothetical protein
MASGAGGIGGGGGGGGGKIRTRRCHQGPIKPYQQGRPQHQVWDLDAAMAEGIGKSAGGEGGATSRRPTWSGCRAEGKAREAAGARPERQREVG